MYYIIILEEIVIEISADREFENCMRDLVIQGKDKNCEIIIYVKNYQCLFTVDMFYQLEAATRTMQNLSSIIFHKCSLTKSHLKMLKGKI